MACNGPLGREWDYPARLSCGISINILDFGTPQKHVLNGMTAMEALARPVPAKARRHQQRRRVGADCVNPGESRWEFPSIRSMAPPG
jgi:hypothetical protein